MEVVKQFNQELSSLYETKPPISKAKMTSITKTAIKAIKFYKHVVQSVEKFIQKCKPEYKVPGLYVIDSIVRQSRHQFGSEKDVFAPRFARNILQTFVHLFNCPVEDKSKVIRVLNLWQKNAVFGPEVIQPLFDLADPNHPMHKEQAAAAASNGLNTSSSKTPPSASKTGSQNKPSPVKNDTSLWVHEQAANTVNTLSKQIQFDKKLLDFDYGEEDEDAGNTSSGGQQAGAGAVVDSLGSILSNPEVLRQLQNLQAHLSQAQLQKEQVDVEEKMRRLQEMKQQEEEFDRHLAQTVPKLPFAAECDFKPGSTDGTTSAAMQQLLLQQQQQQLALSAFTQSDGHQSAPNFTNEQNDRDERRLFNLSNQNPVEIIDLEKSESPHDSSESRSRRRRRSSSRTGNRTGGRSRSRSHSRSKRRRSRSWDREKDWKEDKEYDREKERERKKKGLPPLRKNHLSVCSTTLWIGHLSKLVQQEELSDTFGEFGDIVSIDLIPPRGCAFICMNRRQDANKALIELKYHKLHGKTITLAWAPGKGMKGKEWKDFWEVELGVSYIPWNKLSADTDFELLEEGGMFDEDTMPAWMKDKMTEMTEAQKKDRSTNDRKNFGDDSISQEMGMDEMMSVTPSDIPIPTSSHPGFIPLPDGPLPPTSSMGDIKPPPMSVGLQMPQMTSGPVVSQAESGGMTLPTHLPPMSIMSPFGMPRLLMGPGMLGNVPLGVPPPGLLGSPMMLNRMPQPVTSPFNQTGVLSQIPLPSPADKQKAALSSLTVPPPGGADGFGDGLLPLPFALPPHLRMPQGSLESSLLGPPISGSMDMKVDKFEDKSSSDELKDFMHNFDIPPPNLPGLFGTDTSVPPPSVNNLGPQPLMGDSDQRILLDQSSVPTEDKDDRHKLDRDKENDRDRDDRTKDRDFRNSSRDKENKDKDYRDRKERDHRDRERDFRDKDRDYRSRDRDRERDRDRDHRGERDREFRMNRDGRNDGMRDGRDARNEGMRDGRDARNEGMRDGRDGRNDRMRDGRADLRDRDNRDGRDNRNNRERFGRPDREEDRRGRSRERRDKPSRWSKDDDRPQDRRDRDISNENDRNFRNAEGMPINPRDDKGRRDKSPIRDGERHLMPGRSDENERDALGRPLGGPPGNMSLGPPPNGFLGGPPARHPPLLGPLGAPPLFGPRGAGPDGPNFRPSHPLDDFDRPPLDLLPPDFRPPRGEEFNEFDLLPRDRDDFPIRDRPGFDQRHPPPRGHFEDNFGPPSPFESRNRPDFFPHGLRGPGPIGPGTRGIPPLMGAPPGLMGLMFPPRGPPMGLRGAPRPGIWLDPPGGPNGFPSRGPPPEDMFLGSPFEEPPFGDNRGRVNPWKNRDDDRRRESEGNFGESRHGEFREARFEERLASESIPNERLQDAPQEAETVSEPIKEQATFKKPEESAEKVQPVDEQPQSATEQPPVVDERSQQVDERPQQVDERPQQVDEQPKQVDEGLQQVDEGPQQVDECPQQVDECPQQVDERPQLVTEQPQQVDERPQQVDECPQQVNEQPQQFGEQPQQFDEQPQQVDERPQQVDEQPQNFDEHSQRFDEQRQESNQQMYDNVVAMSETFEQMEAMPVEPTNLELNSAVPEIVTETDKSCEMPYRNIANCSEEALGAPEVASEIPSGNVNNNQETELMNRLESNPIELNDSSFKFPSSNEIPPQFDSNVSLVAESVLPDSAFEITPSEACPNLNETPEATINEPMVSGSCAEASIDGTANESDNVVAESA